MGYVTLADLEQGLGQAGPMVGQILAAYKAVHMDIETGRPLSAVDNDLQKALTWHSNYALYVGSPEWNQLYDARKFAQQDRDGYAARLGVGYRPTAAGGSAAGFESSTGALQQAMANIGRIYVSDDGELNGAGRQINARLDIVLSKAAGLGSVFPNLKGRLASAWSAMTSPENESVFVALAVSASTGEAQQRAVGWLLDELTQIVNDESAAHNAGQISDEEHLWLTGRERAVQRHLSKTSEDEWKESAPFRKWIQDTGAATGQEAQSGSDLKAFKKKCDEVGGTWDADVGRCVSLSMCNLLLPKPLDAVCKPATLVGAAGGAAIGGLLGLVKGESTVAAVVGMLSGALIGGATGYYSSEISDWVKKVSA
jgi:hypothetical protein